MAGGYQKVMPTQVQGLGNLQGQMYTGQLLMGQMYPAQPFPGQAYPVFQGQGYSMPGINYALPPFQGQGYGTPIQM